MLSVYRFCVLGIGRGAQSGQDKAVARVFISLNMGLVKLHIQCQASAELSFKT